MSTEVTDDSLGGESVRIEAPDADTRPKKPTFNAEVFLLGDEQFRDRVDTLIPSNLPVQAFETVSECVAELSGNVALVLVSGALEPPEIKRVIRRTLGASEHARVALVATSWMQLLDCELPQDGEFVLPDERDGLRSAIKHLYVQAYYSVTIERYYDVCLSLRNLELQQSADEEDRATMRRLKRARLRLSSYLKQFRGFLDAADFDAMAERKHRFQDLVESPDASVDPASFGLPDACPGCGLDWTSWHDDQRGAGYEQIGANTWRCTCCGHVLADNDPDNYKVG